MTRLPDDAGCVLTAGIWRHVWGPWIRYTRTAPERESGRRRFCLLSGAVQFADVYFGSVEDLFRGEPWQDSIKETWQDDL